MFGQGVKFEQYRSLAAPFDRRYCHIETLGGISPEFQQDPASHQALPLAGNPARQVRQRMLAMGQCAELCARQAAFAVGFNQRCIGVQHSPLAIDDGQGRTQQIKHGAGMLRRRRVRRPGVGGGVAHRNDTPVHDTLRSHQRHQIE